MFEVGFFRCHANDDRDAPVNAGDLRRGVIPNALHKFLHLGDVRLDVTLEEEVQRFGRVDALRIEINILVRRVMCA
jgi:hypothetical protein